MSVRYQLQDDVALVTLDRPDRFNAIEAGLSSGLVGAVDRAGAEARALVLTGEGKAFCSGADLAELLEEYRTGGSDLAGILERIFHPMVEALLNCSVPSVAAVNGVAAGAGLGVALACDIRLMASSAYLAAAFTAVGLVPDSGTTWWLPHHIGVSRSLELALTNRRVGAEEARSLGLCAEVVPDGEVVARAMDQASALASLVPDSLVTTRRLIRDAASSSLGEAMAAEREEQGRLGRTPEHLEGVNAFLEKRPPRFR